MNTNKYGGSGRRKFTFADWDNDGDLDLLVNSKNISFLENVRSENENIYFTDRGPLIEQKLAGHTTSPAIVDWDNNKIPDLIIGAEDGHFYFVRNYHK